MAISNQNLKYLRKLRGWTQEEFAQNSASNVLCSELMKKKGQSPVLMCWKWSVIFLN